jgi:hypothetical protein
LGNDCEYNTEEGESRWAALHRRNRVLETERDDAYELIALIQSQPEAEAQDILRRIRTNTHGTDAGAFVLQIRDVINTGTLLQQQQQEQRQQEERQPPQNSQAVPGLGVGTITPPLQSVIDLPPSRTNTAVVRPSVAFVDGTETP